MVNNAKYSEIVESINKLRELMENQGIDLSNEINNLEKKLNKKTKKNENPSWEVVQLARLSTRPTTLEYIDIIFDEIPILNDERDKN